jgi:hypothetical protein
MTEAKAMALMLRGLMLEMPQETRNKILDCAEDIRKRVNECGAEGVIALTLVAAEFGGEK